MDCRISTFGLLESQWANDSDSKHVGALGSLGSIGLRGPLPAPAVTAAVIAAPCPLLRIENLAGRRASIAGEGAHIEHPFLANETHGRLASPIVYIATSIFMFPLCFEPFIWRDHRVSP